MRSRNSKSDGGQKLEMFDTYAYVSADYNVIERATDAQEVSRMFDIVFHNL